MDPQKPAAAGDEFHQAPPQFRVGEQVPHRVVEEHGIELPETLRPEDFGIAAHHRLESAGLLAHERKRQTGVRNRTVASP